jgi:hypothetical protein
MVIGQIIVHTHIETAYFNMYVTSGVRLWTDDRREPFQQLFFVMNLSCSTEVCQQRAVCLSDGVTLLWFEASQNNIWHAGFVPSHLAAVEGAC